MTDSNSTDKENNNLSPFLPANVISEIDADDKESQDNEDNFDDEEEESEAGYSDDGMEDVYVSSLFSHLFLLLLRTLLRLLIGIPKNLCRQMALPLILTLLETDSIRILPS